MQLKTSKIDNAYFIFAYRGRKNDHLNTFIAGGISGILSWLPTYPSDVIKTRLQCDTFGLKYRNTRHCIQCTVKDTGISILYRGMGSCIYRAFVVNSVVLFVYSQITQKFGEPQTV